MAQIRPIAGIHYARTLAADFARLIAPPYDVLDEKGKAALQAKHPNNIVTVDLPHLPAKTAGPDAVYAQANATCQAWLSAGILQKETHPAIYPYTQVYQHGPRTFHRKGFIATVKLSPFGHGEIVPHEKTYKGPIEDRLKLMHATRMQLSPIFGLYSDPKNEVTNLLNQNLSRPMLSGSLEGVQNDLWSVTDSATINQAIDLMKHRPIYIADGHHRYTTALQYQQDMIAKNGGPLPPNHPANFCLFVLISMQDPGLLILPTHRLLSGLNQFDLNTFKAALGADAELAPSKLNPEELAHSLASQPAHTFGVFDGKTRNTFTLKLKNLQVLEKSHATQSPAWRSLDVAILQHYLLEQIIQPKFTAGQSVTLNYTADASTIASAADSGKCQLGLLLQATPLKALEELGKHGEVMPQKSTYFFPKLATGMVINPLE